MRLYGDLISRMYVRIGSKRTLLPEESAEMTLDEELEAIRPYLRESVSDGTIESYRRNAWNDIVSFRIFRIFIGIISLIYGLGPCHRCQRCIHAIIYTSTLR